MAHRLLVTNHAGTVAILDPHSGRMVENIELRGHCHEVVISADGRYAYVSLYGDGVYGNNIHPETSIGVIDLLGFAAEEPIQTGLGAPHGLALLPDETLLVACDNPLCQYEWSPAVAG